MRCTARLSHHCRSAFIATFFCAVLGAVPAFATSPTFHRVGTLDASTATANQACYWSGTDLECNSTNPTITATGLVGIGTTAPTNILSLSGAAAQTFWMERGTAAGNGLTVQAGGGLSGGTNENGGTLTLASGISTGTGSSAINFKVYGAGSTGTADNAATTAVTITSAGYVGIGTTSPTAALQIGSGQILAPSGSASSPSYSFYGNSNSGMFMYADYSLAFASNGNLFMNYFGGAIQFLAPLIGSSQGPYISYLATSINTPTYTFRGNCSPPG